MEIIPAIYVLDGRCVALYKGSYEQKETYARSPVDMARFFEKSGAEKLHIEDLNSRKEGHFAQRGIIKSIAAAVKIPLQVEASFHTIDDMKIAFEKGASKVILRPFALDIIPEAVKTFGPDKVIVEIQAKGSGVVGDGVLPDGEPIDVVDFAEKLVPLGVKEVIYKDERSEGTLIQPNYDEADRLFLITGNDLKIYVSGGISEARQLRLLKKIGATGAIIGKAFFERKLTIEEAEAAVREEV
jgi:phosphoribosylformimino-5-aminoimidazole carboxamide ribotide isomerase